jgi:hypothetical protein
MGRIYRRAKAGNWWGEWYDGGGRRQRRTLRTRDAHVARARLRQLEVGADRDAPAAPSHT